MPQLVWWQGSGVRTSKDCFYVNKILVASFPIQEHMRIYESPANLTFLSALDFIIFFFFSDKLYHVK